MPLARYVVRYTVFDSGDHEAGPYDTLKEAEHNLLDISTYAGISRARIESVTPKAKTIFDHLKETGCG